MDRGKGRGAPGVSKGYGVTQPTRETPLVSTMSDGACRPEHGWCANCHKNGHPAYMCPLPHKKEWPAPPDFVRWLPPASAVVRTAPPKALPEHGTVDVEVTWDAEQTCACDYCVGKRAALRLWRR